MLNLTNEERTAYVHEHTPQGSYLVPTCVDLGFSFRSCDLCSDGHAGDRHIIHAIRSPEGIVMEFAACVDCLHYVANGTPIGGDG